MKAFDISPLGIIFRIIFLQSLFLWALLVSLYLVCLRSAPSTGPWEALQSVFLLQDVGLTLELRKTLQVGLTPRKVLTSYFVPIPHYVSLVNASFGPYIFLHSPAMPEVFSMNS